MQKTSLIVPLVLAASAAAQTGPVAPAVLTASDYSVTSVAPAGAALDGVPIRTAIGSTGLAIAARSGDRTAGAHASTRVGLATDRTYGAGVAVGEDGGAFANAPALQATGGTSDGDPAGRPGQFGAHDLALLYRVPAGTDGVVFVFLEGRASANAGMRAVVDVDGDGQPDWRGAVDGNPHAARFRVTAGANGLRVGISTQAEASAGTGRAGTSAQEAYAGVLRVFFRPGTNDPDCTFTTISRPCGADLAGRAEVVRGGVRIGLAISNTTPNSLGVVVVGDALAAPMPLPFSRCDLIVDPRIAVGFLTDGNGAGNVLFGIHNSLSGLDVNLQAVVLGFTPAGGPSVSASNAENLVCR